jgi:hypothetical protein
MVLIWLRIGEGRAAVGQERDGLSWDRRGTGCRDTMMNFSFL